MLRGFLFSVFAIGLYSTSAFAIGCFSGDSVTSSYIRIDTGFCTTENYCVNYDYDLRWNYDRTYFFKHSKCPGTRQRQVQVLTCARKDTGQPYTAYNEGEWSRCLRGWDAYNTH